MPRLMENGDIALPFSCAFVVKTVENFDSRQCSVEAKMTMIMRIKCSGLNDLLKNETVERGTLNAVNAILGNQKPKDFVDQEKIM